MKKITKDQEIKIDYPDQLFCGYVVPAETDVSAEKFDSRVHRRSVAVILQPPFLMCFDLCLLTKTTRARGISEQWLAIRLILAVAMATGHKLKSH